MTEPNTRPFTASVTYDLATYHEMQKGSQLCSLRYQFSHLLVMGIIGLFIVTFVSHDKVYLSKMLFIFMGVFWGIILFGYLRNKKGNTGYQQILTNSNGSPAYLEYAFLADGIHINHVNTHGTNVIPYSQIRKLFETDNLFLLILEHRQLLAIRKDSICGGPVCTFTQKLLDVAANVKKKRVKTILPGKIIRGVFIVFSICCVLLAVWWSAPLLNFRENRRPINQNTDYQQIAAELEALGIHGISDDVIYELENFEASYWLDYSPDGTEKCISLLSWAGMGTYAEDTWEWTPSECGVFWFDAEAFDLENMYTNLLLGIRALDQNILCFTDIQEDAAGVDLDAGTGTQKVSFYWNGQQHTLTASVDYDWYDLSFLDQLNEIIEDNTDGKQLYFAYDLGQGFLVFFGDAQWASRFEAATGIRLYTSPRYTGAFF